MKEKPTLEINKKSQPALMRKLMTDVLFAVVALAGFTSVQAQNYTIADLGYPPNASGLWSEAHGINQKGFVVGTWGISKQPYSQYVFLYSNGTNKDLGTISDAKQGNEADYAIAYAINNANQIVGQGSTNGYSYYHAFLDTNGVMQDLDTTGQAWSSANAIDNNGEIVGEFTTSSGLIHAFVYTNGGFLDIGTLAGGDYSSAKGVNDLGIIVGASADNSGNTHGFVYSNNVMTGLGTLGGDYSTAFGINNSGTIVGESWLPDGELRAFVISNGVMNNLGTFGGTNSSAAAINNGSVIVGYSSDSNELTHAFVSYGSVMLNLDTVLPPHCAFTNLAYAYAINDSGQICGGGVTTNGSYDAFLLTPPALVLTCSSNIIVTASSAAGAIVSFSLTATGGCSQTTVIANPPSGSNFPVGTSTVNVMASDMCGHTNTCSFTVTVNPPIYPPIVLTSSSNITMTATSSNGTAVSFTSTATGGCNSPTVVAHPPSGSIFPIGTTTVTNTASDSCGNSTNATFTITVKPLPTPLNITPSMTTTGNQFSMAIQGVAGQKFVIQASTNLSTWVPLLTNTLIDGSTNWADPISATNSCRFYRTITLP